MLSDVMKLQLIKTVQMVLPVFELMLDNAEKDLEEKISKKKP